MKSLFPSSNNKVETIRLKGDVSCDVYVWVSPEGVKIATHMIMNCPDCAYPLSLSTSEFVFDEVTLNHQVKCPARWKKSTMQVVKVKKLRMVNVNEKGKPSIQRCGFSGYIINGELIPSSK